jgi:hypothetical protein
MVATLYDGRFPLAQAAVMIAFRFLAIALAFFYTQASTKGVALSKKATTTTTVTGAEGKEVHRPFSSRLYYVRLVSEGFLIHKSSYRIDGALQCHTSRLHRLTQAERQTTPV